jgi:hypothetical protein
MSILLMRLRFYVFSEEPRNVWLARLGALVMPGRVVAPEMAGGAGEGGVKAAAMMDVLRSGYVAEGDCQKC